MAGLDAELLDEVGGEAVNESGEEAGGPVGRREEVGGGDGEGDIRVGKSTGVTTTVRDNGEELREATAGGEGELRWW